MLNKSKGNMYPWVTHTWNVVKGKCPHDCSYCYMKRYTQPELHFDERELKTDLGIGNFIFVGSSCDIWATDVPDAWIEKVLGHCFTRANQYLFQTKNPARFKDWDLDARSILGCTIETNRDYAFLSKAPATYNRKVEMQMIELPKMVSIEPIMDFDTDRLVGWIKDIKPEFVSIGADSGNNHLPEPSPGKLNSLIKELQGITQVKIKDNLKRLSIEQ